jgi:redox-sensitive bicupin YhaK (pirin superfamily)
MSNVERAPQEVPCGGHATVVAEPVHELYSGTEVPLGGPRAMRVTRTLPNRTRRMVGAWCFLDYYGPADLTDAPGMRVPPHPHTGLQTVSWLVAGEVLHRDSLGSHQLVRPGQLNLMTAGSGISHSEQTPTEHSPVLHGVQLWTALPDAARHTAPRFSHHAELPALTSTGCTVLVFLGQLGAVRSPAQTFSPLVGAEAALSAGADTRLPLEPDWEYAALVLAGTVEVDGRPLSAGPLLYLGRGRSDLSLRSPDSGRVLLLGGEPFDEQILMWWNFIGRDHEEIVAARAEWMSGRRFGTVVGDADAPLPAPAMPTTRLRPRGRQS